ncbi:aldehyde dehydrogenase family protein [Hoeflea sp. YIM 152468]|uniref:aldehyde dehydrogenase family protein n=1 Tax=Hoeflea sp. YIM 152468 TaxID=3031759 RepID=UPI0023DB4CC1|nr:aldehyde dehydrogenase family protein [Hoeflea sp. YIM 152468]MDF1609273.1 aldehyde dehydrogenase family protein [Hoeflea sp. YIM 152468]
MLTQPDGLLKYLTDASSLRLPQGHFIDGEFRRSRSGRSMQSEDPGRGEAFADFARGDADDIADAVSSSRKGFAVWRRTPPADRGRVLNRTAELIRQNAERLAIAECLDSGKPIGEARGDVSGAARTFEYYAGACDKLEGQVFPLPSGYVGFSQHEPVGVTAHIIPWNFPISTAARGMAPALAAGCSVIAKPAEQTPFTALLLAELLAQAGLPAGVCNVVTGTGVEAGAPLVAHTGIDHVTFTGSVATGAHVMRACAENVTRSVMELGGKSPVVVLDDCDFDAAIANVTGAIFEHAGQICSAGSRLVIEAGIHDRFVETLAKKAAAISLGHGLRSPDMGPVNSAAQRDKILGFLDRARERGAEFLAGGLAATAAESGKGYFIEPTIVASRPQDDELVQEEIFGPVLTVQKADDADHALHLANCTRFGLVAGVFTRDFSRAHQLARDIDAGQVYINEYFAGGIEVPFGGNKQSGFGREKGLEGLKSYCKTKSIAARIG